MADTTPKLTKRERRLLILAGTQRVQRIASAANVFDTLCKYQLLHTDGVITATGREFLLAADAQPTEGKASK